MSFLYGKELQKEIKQCLSSKKSKRCVVAFVGRDASKFIKGKCEILCDLFSSGTNPYEIKKLLLRKNVSIRHKKNLHAKIYLTDSFAILGSANMTNHALNFDNSENTLIEACSKFEKNSLSKNYKAIKCYVDSLWEEGSIVTLQMVDEAIENYRERKNDEIPSRLNMRDFCDKPFYICLYTDANLTKEGEKIAKRELGANWSCKDYSVWENWKDMPNGYFFDLYWHPRSKKIEYCGFSKYNGMKVQFKYEKRSEGDGTLYVSNVVKKNSKEKNEIKAFINDVVIPLVEEKYTLEEIKSTYDDGIIISFNELLDE